MVKKSLLLLAGIIALAVIISIIYLPAKPAETPEYKIKQQLIGMQLEYSNIAGQPMSFTITEKDIKSIEKITLNNETVWKSNIKDMWNIYFDGTGTKVIKQEQLFMS